jgi:Trypsin
MRASVCSVLVVLVATGACAPPAERTSARSQAVWGGKVEDGYAQVGMLEFTSGRIGTGTLVAPDVVLTAGHVIGGDIKAFYTGAGLATPPWASTASSESMTRHDVAEKVKHPSYECTSDCATWSGRSLDVGLVRLKEAVGGFTPIALDDVAPPRVGDDCTTVGFGLHLLDAGGPDAEALFDAKRRRSAEERVVELLSDVIHVTWSSGIADHGDSGGPLFCGQRLVGTVAYHTDGDDVDHRDEFYARVDAALPWIKETLARWTPNAAAADAGDGAAVSNEAPVVASGAGHGCQVALPRSDGGGALAALAVLGALVGRVRLRRARGRSRAAR